MNFPTNYREHYGPVSNTESAQYALDNHGHSTMFVAVQGRQALGEFDNFEAAAEMGFEVVKQTWSDADGSDHTLIQEVWHEPIDVAEAA